MAASVALSVLRTAARQLANMETSSVSGFVTDTELNNRINEALRNLYDKLIGARGQEYYGKTQSVTTANGTATYALATDFYQLLGVIADDGTSFIQLPTWEHQELARLLKLEKSSGSLEFWRYRLYGTNIEIRPKPTAANTLTIRYVPTMTTLVADTDTFDGVNGWEKWATLTVAITLLHKEESDATGLIQERSIIDRQIEQLASSRDAGRPPRITDTRRDGTTNFTLEGLRNDWEW